MYSSFCLRKDEAMDNLRIVLRMKLWTSSFMVVIEKKIVLL